MIYISDYFVKCNKELLSKYDNFVLLVYVYFFRFCSIEHYVSVTIKDLVSYFKFKPDRNTGRSNDKFKAAIQKLIDDGYIEFISCYSDDKIFSFKEANYNQMICLKLIEFDDYQHWNPEGNFVKFDYKELDAILAYKNVSKVDKLVSTYLNIKKWISATESNTSRYVAFPSENKLASDIGCSTKSIQVYTNELVDIKILHKKNYGSFKRLLKGEEITQNANTVYALEEKYIDGKYDKGALIDYMKQNYQMIGDDFSAFNQPLNNYQGDKIINGTDANENDSSFGTADSYNNFSIASDKVDKPKSLENMSDLDWLKELKDDMQDEGDDDIPESIAIGDNWGIDKIPDDEFDEYFA